MYDDPTAERQPIGRAGQLLEDLERQARGCEPIATDEPDTLRDKLTRLLQICIAILGFARKVLAGLGIGMKPAVFLEYAGTWADSEMVHVQVDGKVRPVAIDPDLLPDMTPGRRLYVDSQVTRVVDLVPPETSLIGAESFEIRSIELETNELVVRRAGVTGEGMARRVTIGPRADLDGAEPGWTAWVRDGVAIRVEETPFDDDEAIERWEFHPHQGLMPADIIGVRQRRALARLLGRIERLLEGRTRRRDGRRSAFLWVGLPGNGKTAGLAAVTEGVRHRYGPGRVLALAVAASDLFSKYVGESSRNLRCAIEAAANFARADPRNVAFLIIEEIESAAVERGGANAGLDGGAGHRFLSTLLDRLSGSLPKNLYIFLTSNHAHSADGALRRRVEFVNFPKLQEAEQLQLLNSLLTREPDVFEAIEACERACSAALKTVIGTVQVGTDKLDVLAHHAMTGALVRQAFDRCVEHWEGLVDLGLDGPAEPLDLASDLLAVAAESMAHWSLSDTRSYLSEGGLVPTDKTAAIVERPAVVWAATEDDALDDDTLVDELLDRWSVQAPGSRP